MISLIRAELRRFASRRLVRIFGLLALAVVLLVEIRLFAVSNRDLAGARARAERRVEEIQRESAQYLEEEVRRCQAEQAAGRIPPDVECSAAGFGGEIDANDLYQDPRLRGRDALPDGTKAVAVATALLAFVIGASWVGAEWQAGTMQALLFWEPRRGRVLAAKGVALVAGMAAFVLALQAVVYGLTFLTASTRGSTEGVTGGLHVSNLLTVGRGTVVVAITALLGYAFAGLARHTVAALVVALGYFAILENLIRAFRPGWQRFLVGENVASIMEKKVQVAPASGRQFDGFGDTFSMYTLTGIRGVVTLGVYLAVLLGVFYVTFTRRDVT